MSYLYVQDYGTNWDKDSIYEAVGKLRRFGDIVSSPIAGQYVLVPRSHGPIHEFDGTESRIRWRLKQIALSLSIPF